MQVFLICLLFKLIFLPKFKHKNYTLSANQIYFLTLLTEMKFFIAILTVSSDFLSGSNKILQLKKV
jgi:hypothetical protein